MYEPNLDPRTVESFGAEWSRFNQSRMADAELRRLFEAYFHIFPWSDLPADAEGFDIGCGTGRWDRFVAPRVGHLHCIDASVQALQVAKETLSRHRNCSFHVASVDAMPIPDKSMDFGYSLGVLHHVPDTAGALAACALKLKPGAPFLCYLYYRFDNRPLLYRALWRAADGTRRVVSRMPQPVKFGVAEAIAALVYLPFARAARGLERRRFRVGNLPLAAYRHASFYTMRTDALDRFGTRLERRFTAPEIRRMMIQAGFRDISFSDQVPYWCAIGYKA